jgi:hypothetical protein
LAGPEGRPAAAVKIAPPARVGDCPISSRIQRNKSRSTAISIIWKVTYVVGIALIVWGIVVPTGVI